MDKERSNYLSYLLRLWQVENHGEAPGADEAIWRASLESARTGEREIFANLNDLFDFLRELTGRPTSHPNQRENS
jgi:hypothetical protein